MCGGIPELLQGGVDLQCFCKGSCALRANLVVAETGGGEGDKLSAGGDSPDTVWAKETHLSDTNVRFCSRDFASSMIPDMSVPPLVSLLSLKLR